MTGSERRDALYPYGPPVTPEGVFIVALMDITNSGLESDDVGYTCSFRVEDSIGRRFDMAELELQSAAQDEYGRDGVYDTIQPGFTSPMVFVFDVLPESTGLFLVSDCPW